MYLRWWSFGGCSCRMAGWSCPRCTRPFDWLQRGGGDYFAIEPVEELWQQTWRVRYWRQPLERWCAEFANAGFAIERLVEPRPIPAMAEHYPEDYAKLRSEPGFIAFSLRPVS